MIAVIDSCNGCEPSSKIAGVILAQSICWADDSYSQINDSNVIMNAYLLARFKRIPLWINLIHCLI